MLLLVEKGDISCLPIPLLISSFVQISRFVIPCSATFKHVSLLIAVDEMEAEEEVYKSSS